MKWVVRLLLCYLLAYCHPGCVHHLSHSFHIALASTDSCSGPISSKKHVVDGFDLQLHSSSIISSRPDV